MRHNGFYGAGVGSWQPAPQRRQFRCISVAQSAPLLLLVHGHWCHTQLGEITADMTHTKCRPSNARAGCAWPREVQEGRAPVAANGRQNNFGGDETDTGRQRGNHMHVWEWRSAPGRGGGIGNMYCS